MELIEPYRSLSAAMDALDNGGRFYHWASHAGDQLLTAAELRKGAGGLRGDRSAAMHYAIATSGLSDQDQERLGRALADDARKLREHFRPTPVTAERFAAVVEADHYYLLEGEVRAVEDTMDEGGGYVLTTTIINNVPMHVPTKIRSLFTIYEIDGVRDCRVVVSKRLDPLTGRYRFAGGVRATSRDRNALSKRDGQVSLCLEPVSACSL